MQHGALLGAVDGITPKHGGNAPRQIHRPRQIEQQRQSLRRDALARHIQQPGIVLDMQMLPAFGIRGCQIPQVHLGHVFGMCRNGAPRR